MVQTTAWGYPQDEGPSHDTLSTKDSDFRSLIKTFTQLTKGNDLGKLTKDELAHLMDF